MILNVLEEERIEIINGKLENITNLEALIRTTFNRAIDHRAGKVGNDAARILLEYAVGKPKNAQEDEDMRDVTPVPKTRNEAIDELREASALLGIEFDESLVEEYIDGRTRATQEIGAEWAGGSGNVRLLEAGGGGDRQGDAAGSPEGGQEAAAREKAAARLGIDDEDLF
jgi:hypothetical protein